MTKTFKGEDRFRKEGEWEELHKGEFVVRQIECQDGKLTVFYVKKGEAEEEE